MENKPANQPSKKQPNSAFKYYSVAIQMVVTVVAAVFVGKYLDGLLENKKPLITIILTIMAIIGSLYAMIRKVMNK